MEISEIKQQLSILQVLKNYNLEPDKNNLLKCCFHEDKTASLQIYPNTNTYHCFSCGKSGDTIQFIQDKEKIIKHEAIKKAASMINDKCLVINEKEKETNINHLPLNINNLFNSFKTGPVPARVNK